MHNYNWPCNKFIVAFPNLMISKYGLILKVTKIMVELQFYNVILLLIVLSFNYFTQSSQVCNTSRPMVSAYLRRLVSFFVAMVDLCWDKVIVGCAMTKFLNSFAIKRWSTNFITISNLVFEYFNYDTQIPM